VSVSPLLLSAQRSSRLSCVYEMRLCFALFLFSAFAVSFSTSLRDLLQSARRDARQLTRFSGLSRRNISCDASTAVYRTFDGSCNNVAKPWFGQTGELIRRDTPPRYADGIGAPIVPVNARKISDAVFAVNGSDTFFPPGDRAPWSTLFVGIAQFFLHDLIHMAVPNASDPMPITSTIPFYRSSIYSGSGTSKSNPRQYTSSTTQWIDLSTVYGVTSEWNSKLRSHTGGRMLTGEDGGLPFNTAGLPMESGFWPGAANPAQLFMCGDPRCNQDFFLCSMHDLFLREHNRLADELAAKNPSWDDEKVFQEARRRNTFIWQNIVLREFTLSFFEGQNSSFYRHLEDTVESGYDATLNPSVSVAWDLVYRFHVILRDFVARDATSNAPLGKVDFSMRNTYNATSYLSYGIESLVLGMAQTQANGVGLHMTDDMRNAKLTGSNQVAFDLAATSIQRSYDYGTGGLNDLRRAYGLPGYQAFEDITRDQETVARLKQVFAHPENIDVYTGALAEGTESVPLNHATVGPLITAMILRGALGYSLSDRFFYLHKNLPTSPTAEEWDLINNSTLANLITRNTKVKCISDFPLLYDPSTTSLPCYSSKILMKK
jgi:peroxidase